MTLVKLDDRDLQILAELSRAGRLPKTELARRVNLSPTPLGDRLRRLEETGVIEGYRANIALRRIAPHVTVFVVAELDNHRVEIFQGFEKAVAAHDEITGCWALGGGFDYLMQVVTRDIDSYQRLIDALLESKIGLARYFTYIVTKTVKSEPPMLAALLDPSQHD